MILHSWLHAHLPYTSRHLVCALIKVFVECIDCVAEFEEASSSSSSRLATYNHEVSPNIRKLKRTCIESSRHF